MLSALERYIKESLARQEARMRLPVLLRVLLPVTFLTCVLGPTIISIYLLAALHHTLHPAAAWPAASGPSLVLIVFIPFFGWLGPGGWLANTILHLVPPLRLALDLNAVQVPGASYEQARNGFAKATAYLFPPASMLSLLGAIAPWVP